MVEAGYSVLVDLDFKKSLEHFRFGVLLDPTNASCYCGQCQVTTTSIVYGQLPPEHFHTAIWCGEEAHRLAPMNPRIMGDLSVAYSRVSDYMQDEIASEYLTKADELLAKFRGLMPEWSEKDIESILEHF